MCCGKNISDKEQAETGFLKTKMIIPTHDKWFNLKNPICNIVFQIVLRRKKMLDCHKRQQDIPIPYVFQLITDTQGKIEAFQTVSAFYINSPKCNIALW
jgi:hypothetical protein